MKKTRKVYIYGKHALMEAVETAPHTVERVFLEPHHRGSELERILTEKNITLSILKPGEHMKGVDTGVSHQGIVGRVSLDTLVVPFSTFMETLSPTSDTAFVLLGEIQDPHNVGAIIRSAAAFGISAVLIPSHNQAPVTGTVVKVSAGMAFRVPLVEISNVNETIRALKKKGFWVYGLAGEGKESVTSDTYEKPTVFVLGNESSGIREKTRELCDALISIPMNPKCESLNVASSAAITLYEWSRNHPNALRG